MANRTDAVNLCETLGTLNPLYSFVVCEHEKDLQIHTDCPLHWLILPKEWYLYDITLDGHAKITNRYRNSDVKHAEYPIYNANHA